MATIKPVNPIETAITDYLTAKGIKFAATGGTATKRDDWECDHWSISFVRTGKKDAMITDYYTGIGHRELTAFGKKELQFYYKNASQAQREHVKKINSRAVVPHVAGVLSSLLMEAQGAEQNFLDWCSDFGYDTDSMKAHATYTACCETLQKMRSFFTSEERQAMQEILQDY